MRLLDTIKPKKEPKLLFQARIDKDLTLRYRKIMQKHNLTNVMFIEGAMKQLILENEQSNPS